MGDDYLADFLEQVSNQTIFLKLTLNLRLVQPSQNTENIVRDFESRYPDRVRVLTVESRETLGASWNRMIEACSGQYLAIWNVDDRRYSDSLERQWRLLAENPALGVAYGAFGETREFGKPPFRSHELVPRSGIELSEAMHLGPFFMFRRSVMEQIGLFDEQFLSAADYDFAVRLAKATEMGHIQETLGDFLNARKGLSTSLGGTQPIERTVVEIRSGNLEKVRHRYIKEALRYNISCRLEADKWVPVEFTDVSGLKTKWADNPAQQRRKFASFVLRALDWLDSQIGKYV